MIESVDQDGHEDFKDVLEAGAGLEVGAPQVGPLFLLQVDDRLFKVVGAVVEKCQHRGSDELGTVLGQGASVYSL